MGGKRLRVTFVTRQPVRLAEGHKVLVTVQFPRDLFVADHVCIEVVQTTPMIPWRRFTGDGFEVPVHRSAEVQVVKTEQIESTEADVEAIAARDAEAYGVKKENLLQYYLKNGEIAERVKSEKLVDRLKEKFVVKDIEVKD